MLRESYRLIRALPCLKNNRERLPIAKLLDKSKGFVFVSQFAVYLILKRTITETLKET